MDYEFRVPTPKRQQPARSEDLSGEIQDEPGESRRAEPTDDAEARADSWSVQGDFIYRHHNLEFNSTCRRKKHSPFNWNTLMLQGLLVLIWMCYKRNELNITETSIRANICQIRAEDLQSSLYWKRSLQRIHVVRWETDKDSNDYQTRLCMARSMDENW